MISLNHMLKRILVGATITATMLGGMANVAFADGGGYGSQPGYVQASECGVIHGVFGYFNGDTNLGVKSLGPGTPVYHDGAVGQDPGATGSNNSSTGCNL